MKILKNGQEIYNSIDAAGEIIYPYVYIDGNSGTLNYMTVEVFKLNKQVRGEINENF